MPYRRKKLTFAISSPDKFLLYTDRFAVQVDDMTEKKTAIKLTAETESGTVAADLKRCIICQTLTPEPTTSTENGRS